MKFVAKMKTQFIDWFDYQVVYRLFMVRFNGKFASNPKMRNVFIAHMTQWGIDHDNQINEKRKQFRVVDKK